jgi:hypothetical protein
VTETEWSIFTQSTGIILYQQYAGEIRFGPYYLFLKSTPTVVGLEGKIFGDWFFSYKDRIFLQQWNSLQKADANLLCINTITLELAVIEANIPSVFWSITVKSNNTFSLECTTGYGVVFYPLH